jgi:NADH-quinone oxidoreductase subunit H
MPVEAVVKVLFIFVVMVVGIAPVITWIERKQSAIMQDRIGANRADVAGITILGLFHLYIFAIGSIAAYGTIIAGWSSNNNWSMLGGLRASAQMISYEVTMGLTLVGVFMVFETLRLSDMALAQDTTFRVFGFLDLYFGLDWRWIDWVRVPAWGIFYQPLGFLMFLAAIMAENKRPPFDMPEGESEIIAGYHLEYSGMRFGLFFMSEFIEIIVIAALTATIFLGGWAVPWFSTDWIIETISPWVGVSVATALCILIHFVTFILKVFFMIWVQMLLRWSLPRFRYDQVMSLCWKILLPLSIANIFATGLVLLWVGG